MFNFQRYSRTGNRRRGVVDLRSARLKTETRVLGTVRNRKILSLEKLLLRSIDFTLFVGREIHLEGSSKEKDEILERLRMK